MAELPTLGVQEEMPIIKKNRLTTGVGDLDLILEGGYLNPADILLIGPAGMEKMAFAFHFARAKKSGEVIVFITTDQTAKNVREKAASIGLKLPEDTIFIDCYSASLGAVKEEKNVTYISSATALEDFSVAIKEIIEKNAGKRIRLVFNTFSTFLLYNPKDSILKFLQVVGGRLRNGGATTLFIVEEGVHDKQLISTVERSMDEKYIIHDKGGGAFDFEIFSAGITIPIKLGPNGVAIV
jgi:KaiC/GvpD/RAD55 family RecA-like ATPase